MGSNRTPDFRCSVILLASFLAAACAGAPSRPDAPMASGAAVAQSEAAPGEDATISADLARLRAATAPFKDLAVAEKAGYPTAMSACVQHQPHGAMGYHLMAPKLVDDRLDVEHPEILTFERGAEGVPRLTGVEYVLPLDRWKGSEPPKIFNREMTRSDALDIWYIHVWAFKKNPLGLFADWNPTVKCLDKG